MKTRTLLLGWMLAFLSGCAGVGGSSPPRTNYDFGIPPAPLPGIEKWQRGVLVVHAPAWLDRPTLLYRLAYQEPARVQSYAESRWAGDPSGLLGMRLRQRLGLLTMGSAKPQCVVRVEVEEFSQIFDTPTSSRGLLRVRAVLTDARQQSIATTQFTAEAPAPSADAKGGVAALAAASDSLARDMSVWLNEAFTPKSGHAPASCR